MSFLRSFFSREFLREPQESVYKIDASPHPHTVIARPHPQSKRLTLRWDGVKGVFRLTHPRATTEAIIQGFIHKHHLWMTNVSGRYREIPHTSSSAISILGETYHFVHDPLRSKGIWRLEDVLVVGGPKADHVPAQLLQSFLIEQARQFLTETSQELAHQLGVAITRISIRDSRSRWGSCSSSGALSYSWRIVLADRAVATYLCAHEVSHLKEMNHSKDFWAHVARLCPHFKESRRWLKSYGHTLRADRVYDYER